jgi:hypothetical protein
VSGVQGSPLARQADTAPLRPYPGHRGEHQHDGGERFDGMHDDQYHRREDCAYQESQRVVGGDEIGDWRRMAIVETDEGAARRELLQVLVAELTQRLDVRFER